MTISFSCNALQNNSQPYQIKNNKTNRQAISFKSGLDDYDNFSPNSDSGSGCGCVPGLFLAMVILLGAIVARNEAISKQEAKAKPTPEFKIDRNADETHISLTVPNDVFKQAQNKAVLEKLLKSYPDRRFLNE